MSCLFRSSFFSFILCLMLAPSFAAAQDRVTAGGDVVVQAHETVDSVASFGGNVTILGTVRDDVFSMGGNITISPTGEVGGDVASMGGNVSVASGGEVHGEATTMGGNVNVAPGGQVRGETNSMGGNIAVGDQSHEGGTAFVLSEREPLSPLSVLEDAVGHVVTYALLFLLGLFLIGLFRDRFDGIQVSMIRRPWPSLGAGLLAFVCLAGALLALVVTIIGIPVAVLLGLAAPLVVYVGMAAAAAVIGAALPIVRLRDRPILQLAAGVGVLFLLSLLPFIGGFLVGIAAVIGTGALVLSRFKPTAELAYSPG